MRLDTWSNQPRALPPSDVIRVGVVKTASVTCTESESGRPTPPLHWHFVNKDSMTKHALVVGATGSGKSVTTRFLIRELDRVRVPFLIVEPVKSEYFDKLRDPGEPPLQHELRRWTFEGTPGGNVGTDFMVLDPMRLQRGVSVARHISYLKACFATAMTLSEVGVLILENVLWRYYTSNHPGGCGLKRFARGPWHEVRKDPQGRAWVYPSFRTFIRYFREIYLPTELPRSGPTSTEFTREMNQLFERRFENLRFGPLSEAMDRADRLALSKGIFDPFNSGILRQNAVIELDAVTDNEHKALIMGFLMTLLFERRQADALSRSERRRAGQPGNDDNEEGLRHVLVLEEAHRLLATQTEQRSEHLAGPSASGQAVSMFVDMLAEIRAFGQGIVVVEQIPTKIVPEAVKNTNLKIMLRLPSQDDRDMLGAAMNFTEDQKRFVTQLRTGECVVFEEQLDQPLLLSLPNPDDWAGFKLFC